MMETGADPNGLHNPPYIMFSPGKDVKFGNQGFLASADDWGHRSFCPIDFYRMKSRRSVGSFEQML